MSKMTDQALMDNFFATHAYNEHSDWTKEPLTALDPDEEPKTTGKFNPNHEPAGSPEGGQFAPAEGGGGGSSSPSIQNDPRLSPAQLQGRLSKYKGMERAALEGEIAKERVEFLAAYDASGKQALLVTSNAPNKVEVPQSAPAVDGGVLTHNHPGGVSFSPTDVALFLDTGAAEIRAVGRGHSYSIKGPSGPKSLALRVEIMARVHDENQSVKKEFARAVSAGKMSVKEADSKHWDTVMGRALKGTQLTYSHQGPRNDH